MCLGLPVVSTAAEWGRTVENRVGKEAFSGGPKGKQLRQK